MSTHIINTIENKMLQRNYAKSTINTYVSFIKQYFLFCKKSHLDPIKDAEPFIRSLISKGAAVNTQNQAINAIKYYWENYEGMNRQYIKIERPLKNKVLPTVLSVEEVGQILGRAENLKHRTMLSIVYACGLRVSELCNLKVNEINGKRNSLHIKQSKGRKDRIVPLPESLLVLMRKYYLQYKPTNYLFEGQNTGDQLDYKPYSATSVRKIIKRLASQAGIRKNVTPHTLRHCYATHLYEKGISLRSIQVLLGHSSSKTTEIYTHISNTHILNTPSPLDYLPSQGIFEESQNKNKLHV
jgi:site-specific recombinase XerD